MIEGFGRALTRVSLVALAAVGIAIGRRVAAILVPPAPPPPLAQALPAGPPAGGEALGADVRATAQLARLSALRRIAAENSYLPAVLSQGDSSLRRWSDRSANPIGVFLPDVGPPGYSTAMSQAVENAFARWQRVADIPVGFRFVRDTAHAEVIVRWIAAFDTTRTGQADIKWTRGGWLQAGTLTLATHAPFGRGVLPVDAVYTVALHEIGHLLGLGHSDDPRDVMYPTTEVHDITARDRATARLLYAVPPGSYKSLKSPAPTGGPRPAR